MAIDPCPPVPPLAVRGIVRFDSVEFLAAYPSFSGVNVALLQGDFDVATIFLNNSCCSVVRDANRRQQLLYMLTAHVAALLQGENGKPPSGIVGRINEATEGSVNVGAEYASEMSMSDAYFAQTPYGALFWAATVRYRSGGVYVGPPLDGCVGRFPGYFGGSNCC